jgi:hypothetical protein
LRKTNYGSVNRRLSQITVLSEKKAPICLSNLFLVFTIPKAFPGYGLAFAETSGFEAATQPWE